MKIKITSFSLIVITILLSFISCTPSSFTPSTVGEDDFAASSTYLVYKNLYYTMEKTDEMESDTKKHTLKYHNLDAPQQSGIPVYSDVLSGSDDPFLSDNPTCQMVLDKKATAENGGMPVLIVAQKIGNDADNVYARIFSFNTANNKMTLIADNITNYYDIFWLCGDDIYFYCYLGTFEDDGQGGFAPFKVSKKGGDVTQLEFPSKDFQYKLIGTHENELYFTNTSIGEIYKSDLNFKNATLMADSIFKPFISGGYLYYQVHGVTEKDGGEVTYFDFFRKPLNNFSNVKEEKVIEGAAEIIIENGKIYYSKVGDAQMIKYMPYSEKLSPIYQIKYCLETKSGETSTLYDYSNNPKERIRSFLINDYYYIYESSVKSDESLLIGFKMKYYAVKRSDGKEIEFVNSPF